MNSNRLVFGSFSEKPYVCDQGVYRAQDNSDFEEPVTREELIEAFRKYLGEDKKRRWQVIIGIIALALIWGCIILQK